MNMTAVVIVLSVFGALLLGIALVGAILVAVIKTVKGTPLVARTDPEETRMIQEMFRGLERMEQRIEALETILDARAGRTGDGPPPRNEA